MIILNGAMVEKAKSVVRVGDIVVIPQGVVFRTIRVKGLGSRRGPSLEARLLYEEAADPVGISQLDLPWKPLLMDD